MAYNENLAERIADILTQEQIDFYEKKMFGGLAFMIQDKMCIGLAKEKMMLLVLDAHYLDLLEENGAGEMDFTGRSLKGFLYIEPEVLGQDKVLKFWVDKGIEFGIKGEVKTKKSKK